jgi:predicted dithiol-disulfide oxidoreductase (DUF899 family)
MQPDHPIVSREEWLAARKLHLAKEKEFTIPLRLLIPVSKAQR